MKYEKMKEKNSGVIVYSIFNCGEIISPLFDFQFPEIPNYKWGGTGHTVGTEKFRENSDWKKQHIFVVVLIVIVGFCFCNSTIMRSAVGRKNQSQKFTAQKNTITSIVKVSYGCQVAKQIIDKHYRGIGNCVIGV